MRAMSFIAHRASSGACAFQMLFTGGHADAGRLGQGERGAGDHLLGLQVGAAVGEAELAGLAGGGEAVVFSDLRYQRLSSLPVRQCRPMAIAMALTGSTLRMMVSRVSSAPSGVRRMNSSML